MQILAFTLKKWMLLHLQDYVQIARRPTVRANIALFLIADSCAIFHAARYRYVNLVLLHHAAFAFALAARIGNHASHTLAGGARSGNTEHCLLVSHLAAACAGLARGRSFAAAGSRAFALLAGLITADLDLGLLAEGRFFERQRNISPRVTAALHPATSSAPGPNVHAEEVAEDVAENVADVGKVGSVKPAKAATIHGSVAVLVIACALV